MPPEAAAACVYSAASFIHVQVISKKNKNNKRYNSKWGWDPAGEWQREEWQ